MEQVFANIYFYESVRALRFSLSFWHFNVCLDANKIQPSMICLNTWVPFISLFCLSRYLGNFHLFSLSLFCFHHCFHSLSFNLGNIHSISLCYNYLPLYRVSLCAIRAFLLSLCLHGRMSNLYCLSLCLCIFKIIYLSLDYSLCFHCVLVVSRVVIMSYIEWNDAIMLN